MRKMNSKRLGAALAMGLLAGSLWAGNGVALAADGSEQSLGDLTLLATTDVHGHAVDYDYFTGEPFGKKDPSKALGMDHLASAIKQVRAERGENAVVTLDNGDLIQGSPIDTYYQNNRAAGGIDPMAAVLNYLRYDVAVVGNHEFNYGLDNLGKYKESLKMPLLGANVLKQSDKQPYLAPYTMLERTISGQKVKIGVVGVVTPGVRVWDKANVEGKLVFQDAVEATQKWVTQVRKEGADVVVVLSHSGLDAKGYKWNPADLTENISQSLAENTTGVDVVIGGHSHVKDKAEVYFKNADGKEVLFTQPYFWARSLSQVTVPLVKDSAGKVKVVWSEKTKPHAVALEAKDYPQDPAILEQIQPWHDKTIQWVKTVVAKSTVEMSAATSAWEDTPILDFINMVQLDELKKALKGTPNEKLHLISQASPFSRTAIFRKGDVTIADMAALYIYDNTLYGIKLTGKQLRDYLEHSARYYKQQNPGTQITNWEEVTNAQYENMTRGIPDYAYDVLSGVNYHINISKPVGSRIENLTLPDGTPVTDDMEFGLAINNYRWSGGSDYPHVTKAPIIYDGMKEIRELMIKWAIANKEINPDKFFVKNWTVSTSAAPALPNSKDPGGKKDTGSNGGSAADNGNGKIQVNGGTGYKGDLADTGAHSAELLAVCTLFLLLGVALVRKPNKLND